MSHFHKPGMTYFTDPKYRPEDGIVPMHLYAAWSDVTQLDRGVLVAGYNPKSPAAMKPIPPGTEWIPLKVVSDLAHAGTALVNARAAVAEALAQAKETGLKALAEGVTEKDVAVSLGVDRMTVRAWQGK